MHKFSDSPKLYLDQDTVQYVLAEFNDNVTLTVRVIAFPEPTFHWTRQVTSNNQTIPLHSQRMVNKTMVSSSLILPEISESDYTTYFCVVKNTIGSIAKSFVVKPASTYLYIFLRTCICLLNEDVFVTKITTAYFKFHIIVIFG